MVTLLELLLSHVIVSNKVILGLSRPFYSLEKRMCKVFLSLSLEVSAPAAKSIQLCLTLCDPIDGSPPSSPIPGILQARTLEWVAMSFSNAWKWKVKVKSLSRVRLSVTLWTAAYQASPSMGFSRQEYWSGVPLSSLDGVSNTPEFTDLNLFSPRRQLLSHLTCSCRITITQISVLLLHLDDLLATRLLWSSFF